MDENPLVLRDLGALAAQLPALAGRIRAGLPDIPRGFAGFDGFIDTFIRLENPSTMAELGPRIAAASGIAASYPVQHLGDKFGGNGPLFTAALHGLFAGRIDLTYIGAMGHEAVLPIYREALEAKTSRLYTLADPAHSDCLEFDDGKVMLSDLRSCAEITWDRLLERVGTDALDELLLHSRFIGAVNWGKLLHVGEIWEHLARRLGELGVTPKTVPFFMDLAEFEQRPPEDVENLLQRLPRITAQCHTLLSFNLKEAWQMAAVFGGEFAGRKDPAAVADLAAFLKARIEVDRIIIHPNDGAACASEAGCVYLPGPVVQKPLISTGAGDHFGAGCLAGQLLGLDDLGLLLCGVTTSGYYVRSGRSPSFAQLAELIGQWQAGTLPERL